MRVGFSRYNLIHKGSSQLYTTSAILDLQRKYTGVYIIRNVLASVVR